MPDPTTKPSTGTAAAGAAASGGKAGASGGAYGANSNDYRRKWDKDEYLAKSQAQDDLSRSHAIATEAALASGKKPPMRPPAGGGSELPRPTKALEAREGDLGIEKNLGRVMVVGSGGKGPGAGFYCEMCQRTLKDSIAYLDHVNGRSHLARLGQTTQVRRSTVQQVRAHLEHLRATHADRVTSKNFDFEQRLEQVKREEEVRRKEKKEAKKRKREETREEEMRKRRGVAVGFEMDDEGKDKRTKGAFGNAKKEQEELDRVMKEQDEFQAMMGFAGGFGGGVKRR